MRDQRKEIGLKRAKKRLVLGRELMRRLMADGKRLGKKIGGGLERRLRGLCAPRAWGCLGFARGVRQRFRLVTPGIPGGLTCLGFRV